MRRSSLRNTMTMPAVLLLAGCSGFGKFLGDTFQPPGLNPNLPYGLSENTARARGRSPEAMPILPESGNVWPGPPQPLPTLSDVARNPTGNYTGGPDASGAGLRDGERMSMGEQNSVANGADTFSGGGVSGAPVPDAASHYRGKSDGKPIVVPNGDGTYTVIGADGTVKTVTSPPR